MHYRFFDQIFIDSYKSDLGMVLLGLFLRSQFRLVHFKERIRFSGMFTCDIMKCRGGDVIGLAFPDQTIILQKILLFRAVEIRLRLEHAPRFGS
jgi:hypothetical protein